MRIFVAAAAALCIVSNSVEAENLRITKVEVIPQMKPVEDSTSASKIRLQVAVFGMLIAGPVGLALGTAVGSQKDGDAPPMYLITVEGGGTYLSSDLHKKGEFFDPEKNDQ